MIVSAWERVKDLLHRAMQLAPEERSRFLDEECASNTALRAELDSLLAAGDDVRSSFLASTPARLLGQTADEIASGASLTEGQVFAERFQLVRKLGEGGMGQVWLAEQLAPVRRQVALKLIKAGMYDEAIVQRFNAERQSLAIMDHPAIAKVFDAGTTPQGQPYFVMEYVPGEPVTAYCDRRRLTIRERLALFIQACEGVQHAHQKAIVHRDLKPANILVVEVDGRPVPRIIDFGLARAATPQLGEESLLTQAGLFVGTPGYMSPEQADPDVHDVDTRTDVYSLGVVLYVLLTGVLPFDSRQRKTALDELLRKLREDEPPLPSAKIALERTAMQAVAEARSTAGKPLQHALRGELDWIARKALERDRSRRYGTPSELAADLRRHLNNEPVTARPASVGYQLKKYAQRHRALVAGAAAVFAVLVAGVAVSATLAVRARRAEQAAVAQRDLAERRFNDVHKLAREVIFDLQNQLAGIPGTTQVRKDLEAVAINYLDALAKDAAADRPLQGELAAAYLKVGAIQGSPGTENLGDVKAALESYSKAERLARGLVAQGPSIRAKRLLVDVLMAQAQAAKYAGRPDMAAAKATEALALAREAARSDAASEDAQFQLGAALQCAALYGGVKDSIPYLEEETSVFEGVLARAPARPDWQRNAALAHKYVAGYLITNDDPDRAFAHLKRAEELDKVALSAAPNNPEHKMDLAIDLSQWGEYYEGKENFAKAIEYTRASLTIRRELASADPKDAWAQDRLSYILNRLGNLQLHVSAPDALASYKAAKSIAEQLHTESLRAELLAVSDSGMGNAYRKLGDVPHSCASYAESVQFYRDVLKSSPAYARQAEAAEKAYSRCSAGTL